MAQKKNNFKINKRRKSQSNIKKISPFYILLVLIISFAYYHYYGIGDYTKSDYTKYEAYTEVTSNEEIVSDATLDLNIYYFYVGQADCTLVSCSGENMLIDAGNNADGKLIVKHLKDMGIKKIDYLIATHPHEDHIGGIDNIIDNFKIVKFFMPNRQASSKTFEDILDATYNKKLKITNPKVGTSYNLGQATCKILSAKADAEDTNDSSIVIQVNFGKHKFLFAGDLTSNLESSINWEDIDVLKVSHHGSRYSSSQKFLDETKPEISIISDGKNNDYGHPHKETLNRLNKINTKIYRTDKDGTIHLSSDGKNISIESLNISLDGNK